MSTYGYFEGQSGRDCVIHSLNNAFGTRVISKPEVVAYIEYRVHDDVAKMVESGYVDIVGIKKAESKARDEYCEGNSFFSADVVWDCAQAKGVFATRIAVPGVAPPVFSIESFTPAVLARPVVVLGGINLKTKDQKHAIALRDGVIYDSERVKSGPRELTKAEMHKSLPVVYAAYVFLKDAKEATEIRRSIPMFM
jgi:hypothetical protein